MILSTILAAAEGAKRSEAPFFIAGGAFAIFAVLISIVGIRKPDFPTNAGAARGVMALGVLLMLGAMSAIVYVSN
jgi:hypothetical protein